MTDRPIIMSAPMVRAILDGRKTVTRRIVKDANGAFWDHAGYRPSMLNGQIMGWEPIDGGHPIEAGSPRPRCPYGVPGDRLWVRETWGLMNACYDEGGSWATVGYQASDGSLKESDVGFEIPLPKEKAKWAFDEFCKEAARANDGEAPDGEGFEVFRWRPSIHMPRWASRITLLVKSERVERVQDITEEGARAEGFDSIEAFLTLFYNVNKRALRTENPWVWVVSFERTKA